MLGIVVSLPIRFCRGHLPKNNYQEAAQLLKKTKTNINDRSQSQRSWWWEQGTHPEPRTGSPTLPQLTLTAPHEVDFL